MRLVNDSAAQRETLQLQRSVRQLSRQISQLAETMFEIQAGDRAPFLLPSQYLEFFEGIQNPVERSFFFSKHKAEIETGQAARDWQKIEDQARATAQANKPSPGSLSAKLESFSAVDPLSAQRFYRANKEQIDRENQDAFLLRKAPKSAAAASLQTTDAAQTL